MCCKPGSKRSLALIRHAFFHQGDILSSMICMCIVPQLLRMVLRTESDRTLTSFFRLDGVSRLVPGFEAWYCHFHAPFLCFQVLRMNCYSFLYACCIGQAKNPGPDGSPVKFAVVNPTAVNGKIDRLLDLGADCLAVSETSATSIVQKECTHKLKGCGFKSFWSKPVPLRNQQMIIARLIEGKLLDLLYFLL